MKEVKTELKVLQVRAMCDETLDCSGEMFSTGMALPTYPPRYPHKCTVCGAKVNLDKVYPAIAYEEK